MNTVDILGVKIDALTKNEVIDWVRDRLKTNHAHQIVTPNPEMIMRAQKNKKFLEALNSADLHIPDGVGLQMAAEFLVYFIPNIPIIRELLLLWVGVKIGLKGFLGQGTYQILPERVTGVDLFLELVGLASKESWRIYLLGGVEGVAARALDILMQQYPSLQIVGAESGGKVDNRGQGIWDDEIIKRINKSRTEILLVSFGAPKQEFWVQRNIHKFKTVKVAIGGGATLDFIVQKQLRAPKLFQQYSLEWLWRLIHPPRRRSRVLQAFPLFPLYVGKYKYYMVKST